MQAAASGKPPRVDSKGSHSKQQATTPRHRRQHQSPAAATPVRTSPAGADDMDCIPDTPDEASASKAVHAAALGVTPGSSAGKAVNRQEVTPPGDAGAAYSSNITAAGAVNSGAMAAGGVLVEPAATAVAAAAATVISARRMVPESPDEAPKDTLSPPQAASQSHFSSTPAVLQEPPKPAELRPGALHHAETAGHIAQASSHAQPTAQPVTTACKPLPAPTREVSAAKQQQSKEQAALLSAVAEPAATNGPTFLATNPQAVQQVSAFPAASHAPGAERHISAAQMHAVTESTSASAPTDKKTALPPRVATMQQQCDSGQNSMSPLNDSALVAALDSMERSRCQVNCVMWHHAEQSRAHCIY